MDSLVERFSIAEVWSYVRTHLEHERRRIQQEISSYPTPIAACDQQFNHLLEQRSRISQELARLEKAFQGGQEGDEAVKVLDRFVRTSASLDDDTKQKIECCLEERRRGCEGNGERGAGGVHAS